MSRCVNRGRLVADGGLGEGVVSQPLQDLVSHSCWPSSLRTTRTRAGARTKKKFLPEFLHAEMEPQELTEQSGRPAFFFPMKAEGDSLEERPISSLRRPLCLPTQTSRTSAAAACTRRVKTILRATGLREVSLYRGRDESAKRAA